MKKILSTLFLLLITQLINAQIIINEVQPDAGNFDGAGGEWVELKNIGATAQDMSCWRFTNGGSMNITFPQGLILPAGAYLLIGNATKMMCATCDYKFLNILFTLNADGFGTGTGNYSNTIFLNTDIAANGGCDCMTGTGALNNGSLTGDRLILINDIGTITDAMKLSNGDAYGIGILNVNFNATATCPPLPNIDIPATTDIIYNGRTICNDLTGCNSSYARLPDGNNGLVVTYTQTGNLACTGCTDPCGVGTNTSSTDQPTPGIDNNTTSFTALFNANPVPLAINTLTVCGAVPLTFEYQINNFTNVALTAVQATGNLGSYVRINTASPINFATATFNNATGVTTLSHTVTPPVGTTNYEFVWGDANTNCVACPGSVSVNTPNNISSSAKECFVYKKITIIREDPLGGTPIAACALPGNITISGATGTNIQYTLQKQTVVAGPFNTIVGPQNGNSFGAIIDDNADPLLPNYQVLVTSNNLTCLNPAPIIVTVPLACIGNPVCPTYTVVPPGLPTFTPSNNSVVCAGSTVNFSVNINGICNSGLVEVMYDYNPLFDPYTQGISLGTTNTVVGITPPATTATGKVFINEVAPRPQTGACPGTPNGSNPNSGEWVELYNAGPGNVDIGGWIIADGDWTATIPAGTSIAALGYFLIGGGGTFCSVGVLPDLNIETCNCVTVSPLASDIMNLTDGNEQVALFDCSGTFIDGVLWDGAAGAVGQGLPDVLDNNAPAAGCGNYITAKSVSLPSPASFADAGAAPSGGVNVGKYRTAANTWTMTTTTLINYTPKAQNPGGDWNGATVTFGSQCPPPPVTATITVTFPDTCNQLASVPITLKAIYKPQPLAPCISNDVVATANYSIPSCELLTLSGDGDYCIPATAPLNITTSSALVGNYIINLSNGVNNTAINPATGVGPFVTNVINSGIWTINSVTPPIGTCAPKTTGSATINMLAIPAITASPVNYHACYLYYFDLAQINPLIVTSPTVNNFIWYDVPVGGTPINTVISPLSDTVFYVAPTTGAPSNCEGARVPITILVDPLPEIPTVICTANSVIFTQPIPNCVPIICPTGVEYSANGINWSNTNIFTAADPGWAAWGSPANSTLYIRNTSSPGCYNYVYFNNPCLAPLPLKLLHFYGKENDEHTIDLHWETIEEKNVSHFEIERKNADGSYIKIGFLQAKGTFNQQQKYFFNDPTAKEAINYYRLKIVDLDEKYNYSNEINVALNHLQSGLLSIFPNPATHILSVKINTTKTTHFTLQINDMMGKIIYEKNNQLSKGIHTIPIQINSLAKGSYMLKLNLHNEIYWRKFTKE